jgi:uncharacterized protein DUF6962
MTIHDPDVVLTDVGLALLGGFLAWRLLRHPPGESSTRPGVAIMTALASAALFGAIFHAFFPAGTATRAGFIAWIPVSLSIIVVAATLLALALRVLRPWLSTAVRGTLVGVYAATFGVVVLFVDESYSTIVRFYAPTLILFLIVAAGQGMRPGAHGWRILAIALVVSIAAAVLQQRRVAIHPVYLDHNALYHVLQGIGLLLLYLGFTRVGGSSQEGEAVPGPTH